MKEEKNRTNDSFHVGKRHGEFFRVWTHYWRTEEKAGSSQGLKKKDIFKGNFLTNLYY